MYLEEHTVRDLPALPAGHAFHWLEKSIKSANSGLGLNKKDIHDKEHEDQLIYFGCDPRHTSKLSIRKDDDGIAFSDRLYHIMLHLYKWKKTDEAGPRKEAYERFEAESGFNLDDLTLPQPSAPGHEAY
jgi:hypothetical protein